MKQVIIFDYDGTLHQTMRIYQPAIASVVSWLDETCGVRVEQPSDTRISSWLGMNTADMWRDFMPELDMDLRMKAGRRVGDHMLANLNRGLARWYPGTEGMLGALAEKGYVLAVLSNCGNAYAQAHWDAFQMERWFTAFFACETWDGAPKTEILADIAADFTGALRKSPVKRARKEYGTDADQKEYGTDVNQKDSPAGLQDSAAGGLSGGGYKIAAVVGDRNSDLAAAQAVGVPFAGCLYGYGSREELAGSTRFVSDVSEIAGALMKMMS